MTLVTLALAFALLNCSLERYLSLYLNGMVVRNTEKPRRSA